MLKILVNYSPNFLKVIYTTIRNRMKPNYRELQRIRKIKRFSIGISKIFHNHFKFVDSASFCFMYDEIFNKDIYKFKSENENPYIIDAGANIGLSILYFKKLYPGSTVIGFEPDKKVYGVLKENINSFGLKDVTILNKALWNSETTLDFFEEGADGGRVMCLNEFNELTTVTSLSLKPFLENKIVDFLKIDIEGAETIVLDDCKDLLKNVRNLFVEYHSFTNQEQTLDKILSILSNSGFRYYITHIGILSEHPFIYKNEHQNFDNQLNIYATKSK